STVSRVTNVCSLLTSLLSRARSPLSPYTTLFRSEQSIHVYDLARYLLGDPRLVVGFKDQLAHARFADYLVDDVSAATIQFQNRRSEEHTSELQSRRDLVCRLLPEKKMTADDLNFY